MVDCARKFKARDTCNKGFGFTGVCVNTATGLSSYALPSGASNVMNNIVLPLIAALTAAPAACIGDFTGANIANMSSYACDNFPLDTSLKYGVLSTVIRNVPCGTPQTVAMCMTFDQCGTFGISLSGGVFACAATFSTGVGAIISLITEFLSYASFAVSPTRGLKTSFTLAYNDNYTVKTKTVTTRGHFYIGLGFSFPSVLYINGKSIEDIIAYDMPATFIVDLGANFGSGISSLVTSLFSLNKSNAKAAVDNLLDLGAELTCRLSGSLTFGLEELTNGFLQDVSITLAEGDFLITKGGGESGLPAGMYIYLHSDLVDGIADAIQDLIDQFESIMDFIGFDIPEIPSAGLSAGLFIQPTSLGIQFTFAGQTLKCVFTYGKNAGCQFGLKYFTAIINGTKWLIKNASKLFDETGEKITEFTSDAENFAANFKTNVEKRAREVAAKVAAEAEALAKAAANAAKKAAKKAKCGLKKMFGKKKC